MITNVLHLPPPKTLRHLRWQSQRWKHVVKSCVQCEEKKIKKAAADYDQLHADLVETCRCLAADAQGQRREQLSDLSELIQPWMSLKSLKKAEPQVLADLLARVQFAESELQSPRSRTVRHRLRILSLILLAAGLGMFAVLGMDWIGETGTSIGGWLDGITHVIYLRIRTSDFAEQIVAATLLMWCVGMWLLSWQHRS